MFKDKVLQKLNEISADEFHEVNKLVLIKTILEGLVNLNEENIDTSSVINFDESNNLEIRLIPNSKDYISVYISVFDDCVVDIQIDQGGEYLYLEKIFDWSGIFKLRETLFDLFNNEISSKYHVVNEKIKKAFYKVPYKENNQEKCYEFGIVLGGIWFWNKIEIIEKTYKSWVTR